MLEKRLPEPCGAWILSKQGPTEDPVNAMRALSHCENPRLRSEKGQVPRRNQDL